MRPLLPALALAMPLVACHQPAAVHVQPAKTAEAPRPPMPGSDRDAHGCIPSAGYSWCEKTAQCERPWELAQAKGFELSQASVEAYCGSPKP